MTDIMEAPPKSVFNGSDSSPDRRFASRKAADDRGEASCYPKVGWDFRTVAPDAQRGRYPAERVTKGDDHGDYKNRCNER
jgi:hypothetical protein